MIRRDEEIKQIQKEYSWVYPIILGTLILIIGVSIGAWLFGSEKPMFSGNMLAYITNLWTDALSIGIGVFIIERLNARRNALAAEKQEKANLLFLIHSADNNTALLALETMRKNGWLHLLISADLSGANLQGANLAAIDLHDTNLSDADLSNASMELCNLSGSRMLRTKMKGAKLFLANLEKTELYGADLSEAKLASAKLTDADLERVIIEGTFWGTEIQAATLPDGKSWTSETDMRRFTNPRHPNFYKPEWLKEAYR